MKKNNPKKKSQVVTPDEAVHFIEGLRDMAAGIDEPTVAISLRIPGNILKTVKLKAKAEGKKYQSLIVEYLRQGLKQK